MATEPCEIHLQDIERPELVNHRVRVPLVVAGIGKTYSIPSRVTVRCSGRADCLNGPRTLTLKAPEFWLRCLGQRNDAVERMVHSAVECSVRCHHIEIVRTAEHQTVTQIVVNPHYQELLLNSDTGKVTDELGRSWKSVNAVYLGTLNESRSRPYIGEGTVVPHPQNQEITLVIDRLDPADLGDDWLEPVKLSYGQLAGVIAKLERYTGVRGRKDAHFWTLLLYASPPYFRFEGELVEGWGKGLFFGDSTTGKGQTGKSILQLLRKGKYVIAETGSRAGILYGVEPIGGTRVLIWGALPQSDGGLIIKDGCNKMPPQESLSHRQFLGRV